MNHLHPHYGDTNGPDPCPAPWARQALSALAPKLRLTPVDFAPICAAWTGGAIYGSLEGVPDYSPLDHMSSVTYTPDA